MSELGLRFLAGGVIVSLFAVCGEVLPVGVGVDLDRAVVRAGALEDSDAREIPPLGMAYPRTREYLPTATSHRGGGDDPTSA